MPRPRPRRCATCWWPWAGTRTPSTWPIRLAEQVATWLQEQVRPKGVGVVLEADHQCLSLRGVRATGTQTVTSALHGLIRDDARTRQEFLALTQTG